MNARAKMSEEDKERENARRRMLSANKTEEEKENICAAEKENRSGYLGYEE